jgi:hypothetical protein
VALSRFAVLVAVALATPGALTWSDEQPPDAPPAPVVAHFPWTSADAPPTVAGLHLGDTRATVEAALGAATQLRPMGSGLALEYTSQGLSVVLGAAGDVSMIYLLSRTAGSIDGVRVGDSRQQVLAHWGVPPLVQGAQAMYPAGDWAVVAELGPEQRVLTLSLGRAYGNTDLR